MVGEIVYMGIMITILIATFIILKTGSKEKNAKREETQTKE